MPVKSDPWEELMQTCVLGSGRRHAEVKGDGLLGGVLDDAHRLQCGEEEKVLMSLCATALARRAGQAPLCAADLPLPPEPCPEERSRECGPYSITLLNQALAEQPTGGELRRVSLVEDWLRFCSEHHRLIAFDQLPKVMEFAAGLGEKLQQLVADCGGQHFIWLLSINAQWQTAYKNAMTGMTTDDLVELIELGSDQERMRAFCELRTSDPDRARECLIPMWSKESVEYRQLFATAIKLGLSLADEPFLEEVVLNDKRKEVRKRAADALSTLKGSRYLERMQDRAAAIVQVNNGKLAIKLPAEFDDSMKRDELEEAALTNFDSRIGQKAGWLYQIISRVDPSFWTIRTGLNAMAFIKLILASEEWSLPMVLGILNATAMWENSEFQNAIISFEEIHLTESVPGKYFLTTLPPAKVEHLLLGKMPRWAQTDRRHAPRLDLWYYLELVDFQWSENFSRELLRFIVKEIKEKVPVFGHTFYSNAGKFGLRMHPSVGRDLETFNLAAEDIDTWARNGLERFIDTVKLRYEMYKSFEDPKSDTTQSTDTGNY